MACLSLRAFIKKHGRKQDAAVPAATSSPSSTQPDPPPSASVASSPSNDAVATSEQVSPQASIENDANHPDEPTNLQATLVADAPGLQKPSKSLWDRAYDDLKDEKGELIQEYESLLTKELPELIESQDSSAGDGTPPAGQEHNRQLQMRKIAELGMKRMDEKTMKYHIAGQEFIVRDQVAEVSRMAVKLKSFIAEAVKASPAASIAWAGISVILPLFTNPSTAQDANKTGFTYVASRMRFYVGMEEHLWPKHTALSEDFRCELEDSIVKLYRAILTFQVQTTLRFYQGWLKRTARDVASWDDWKALEAAVKAAEGKVNTYFKQLTDGVIRDNLETLTQQAKENYRSLETQVSLMTEQLAALKKNAEKLDGIESAIQTDSQQQMKRDLDKTDHQCLCDLYETDPREDKIRIQDTNGGLLRDSYVWVLTNPEFQNFLHDPHSRLLWIKGDPGKGKTMLMCGIIDELRSTSYCLTSYYFFQQTVGALNNATAALRGLIFFLASEQPLLLRYVRPKYDERGAKLFEGNNAWFSLREIFRQMVKSPELKNAIIVVDGLDECTGDADRNELLSLIVETADSSSSHMKWILSSRNWPKIEEALKNAQQLARLQLELNAETIAGAVLSYIEYKTSRLTYDNTNKTYVKEYLENNAGDTFLWVALVYKALIGVPNRHIRRILETFPSGINPLYDRMMQDMEQTYDAAICKEIMGAALSTYRPLSIAELRVLSPSLERYDIAEVEDIIGNCGSFLTRRGGFIYFVHQSAKEFLLKNASGSVFPFGIASQHYVIFTQSMRALMSTLRRDHYNLQQPGTLLEEIEPPEPNPLTPIQYSIIYWADHLYECKALLDEHNHNDLCDGGTIDRFIREKYLYWLECLGLLRGLPKGIQAISIVRRLLSHMEGSTLFNLIQDAERFLRYFAPAIRTAPLQTYASALVFCPQNSLIGQLFKEQKLTEKITLTPPPGPDWSACVRTLEGHNGAVTSVIPLQDDQRIISGSNDGNIKIWDMESGECVKTLKGHTYSVNSIAVSQDSQRVISSYDNTTIKIWDIESGICVKTLKADGLGSNSNALSRESQRQISWSEAEKIVQIWDTETEFSMNNMLRGRHRDINTIAFSPDIKRIISGSDYGIIKIWDIESRICVKTLTGQRSRVGGIMISQDGQRIISGSDDGITTIWDVETGTCLNTFQTGSYPRPLALSQDNQKIVTVSPNHIKIWNAESGTCIKSLAIPNDFPRSGVAFSQDGKMIVSGSESSITIWDTESGTDIKTLEDHNDYIPAVAFSQDHKKIISGSYDNTIKIWDIGSSKPMNPWDASEGHHDSILLSPDRQKIIVTSGYQTIEIWDTESGTCMKTLDTHFILIETIAISKDSQMIVSGSYDGILKIWDIESGICIKTINDPYDCAVTVAFSQDNKMVISGSKDGIIKIWDTGSGSCIKNLKAHCSSVGAVAFSQDSQIFITGSQDGIIKIWDTVSGICMKTLEGHTEEIMAIALSQDGQRVISGSDDYEIRIWNIRSGKYIQRRLDRKHTPVPLSNDYYTVISARVTFLAAKDSQYFADNTLNDINTIYVMDEPSDYCCLSSNRHWLIQNGKKILWLPQEYRPTVHAGGKFVLALVLQYRRVAVLHIR